MCVCVCMYVCNNVLICKGIAHSFAVILPSVIIASQDLQFILNFHANVYDKLTVNVIS